MIGPYIVLGCFIFVIAGLTGIVAADVAIDEGLKNRLSDDGRLAVRTIGFIFGTVVTPIMISIMIFYSIMAVLEQIPRIGIGFREIYRMIRPVRAPKNEIPEARVVE